MGICSLCYRDYAFKENELKHDTKTTDLENVIKIQCVLRGFIQRKKSVEHSALKYKSYNLIRRKESKEQQIINT